MRTNFVEIMGDNPTVRILDFLIENDRDSWTMVEIRNGASVGYSTLKSVLPKMLKNGLIMVKKTVGRARLFVINKENPIIKKMYELYNTINGVEIKRFIKD